MATKAIEAKSVHADAWHRVADVCRFSSLGRSTIWKMVKQGKFPAPHRIGTQAVAWWGADLLAWAAARRVASEVSHG